MNDLYRSSYSRVSPSAEGPGVIIPFETVRWRGQQVTLRSARLSDARDLARFLSGLSIQTLYQRYFSPAIANSDASMQAEVGRLLASNRITLLGRLPAAETIVVVVEIAWLPSSPDTAEIALTVADEYQRQGLGRAVCATLPALLAARGISQLQATASAENRAVARLFSVFTHYTSIHTNGLVEFQAVLR